MHNIPQSILVDINSKLALTSGSVFSDSAHSAPMMESCADWKLERTGA